MMTSLKGLLAVVVVSLPAVAFAQSTDALMLAFTPGGRERTADEFGVLWRRAGLRCVKQETLPSLGTCYQLRTSSA